MMLLLDLAAVQPSSDCGLMLLLTHVLLITPFLRFLLLVHVGVCYLLDPCNKQTNKLPLLSHLSFPSVFVVGPHRCLLSPGPLVTINIQLVSPQRAVVKSIDNSRHS